MQAHGADPALRTVTFDVGGVCYPLLISDIEKFPGSFFETAIKKEWLQTESSIKVQRDGLLFRYVQAFLVSGALPRIGGKLALDPEVVEALKEEADFFNLPTLEAECEDSERSVGAEAVLKNYHTIRQYMEGLEGRRWSNNGYECEIPTRDHQPMDLIFLLGKIACPFCVQGVLQLDRYSVTDGAELFKSSTLGALNIPELLAECQESAFGQGTETVFDPSFRKSHEILASQLNAKTLRTLASHLQYPTSALARHLGLELRPYKLVVYQEGGHFDAHRDTVRGEGHIGTLVLILNSEYTGGELEITHNGHTEVVTGPYSWVAMYGDCLHKINPVTSGTRVSLIFDIYATRAEIDDNAFWRTRGEGTDRVIGVTDTNRAAILAGIEEELEKHEALIICLSHKYPFCQAVPEFLKGEDLALYELLKDAYATEVVACEVNCEQYEDGEEPTEMSASLFTSFAASKETHARPAKVAKRQPTKFLIPAPIDPAGVLEYSPYLDHAGNEAQPSKSVYLVSGLQLRRRG